MAAAAAASTVDLDAEEEMQQLRVKLLANLNQKRHQQAQQNKEKQMAMDMSLLKRKLEEHELMIVKPQNQQRKIKPVIIPLTGGQSASDEDDDEEYVDAAPEVSTAKQDLTPSLTTARVASSSSDLQENIAKFLKEAKNQAERIVLHSLLPNSGLPNQPAKRKDATPLLAQQPLDTNASTKKAKSDCGYTEAEKKSLVNSLRDKINLETRQISLLQQHVIDLKLTEAKRLKDIESTRVKLASLREQIQAAEKVLKVNQESALIVRQQCTEVGAKLAGMQSSKRLNQKLLQKVLLSPVSASVAVAAGVAKSDNLLVPVQKKAASLHVLPALPLKVVLNLFLSFIPSRHFS